MFTADCMSTQMAKSAHAMTADARPVSATAQASATSTGKTAAGHVWGAASCTAMRGVSLPCGRRAAA